MQAPLHQIQPFFCLYNGDRLNMTVQTQHVLSLDIRREFGKPSYNTSVSFKVRCIIRIPNDYIFFCRHYGSSILYLTSLQSYYVRYCMLYAQFFLYLELEWQRRYEALWVSFIDRLPAKVVAVWHDRLFRAYARGKVRCHTVNTEVRRKIRGW